MPGKSKEKKSFWRRNRDLLLVFLIFTPVYYAYIVTQPVSPFEPLEEPYAPYERHYQLSFRFPFVTSYFLMVPENYRPDKYSYPLVLMLHGVSRHMYGGKVLARPEMRAAFPVFALIPVVPFGFAWALPDRITLRPQALPAAMEVVRSVGKKYSIDEDRIYVTGYSMGGVGTYGALAHYPGVFAAAAPTDAVWQPELAAQLDDVPIWIFHGAKDKNAPAAVARAVAGTLQQNGREVRYTEYPRRGHGTWVSAYENPEFWYWLFSQKR